MKSFNFFILILLLLPLVGCVASSGHVQEGDKNTMDLGKVVNQNSELIDAMGKFILPEDSPLLDHAEKNRMDSREVLGDLADHASKDPEPVLIQAGRKAAAGALEGYLGPLGGILTTALVGYGAVRRTKKKMIQEGAGLMETLSQTEDPEECKRLIHGTRFERKIS